MPTFRLSICFYMKTIQNTFLKCIKKSNINIELHLNRNYYNVFYFEYKLHSFFRLEYDFILQLLLSINYYVVTLLGNFLLYLPNE